MTETAIAEPAVPRKKLFERIAGVLFAPAETFEDIARKPDILAPLLLLILIGYATTALVLPRTDFDAVMQMQADQVRKQNPNVTDADIERMGKFGKAIGTVMAWVSPLLMALWYVVVASVLLLAVRLFGGEGTFRQALSGTLYAWIPLTLFGIIMTIVVLARGSFDPTAAATLVKSNAAFLVDMKEQPVLFTLLSAIDVFTIWTVVLLVFAFAAISRLKRGMTATLVVSLWLALILIRLGFAALSASRMA